MEQKRYGAIDGLRTLACIGIMMMHMEANNSYEISGFIYDRARQIAFSIQFFIFVKAYLVLILDRAHCADRSFYRLGTDSAAPSAPLSDPSANASADRYIYLFYLAFRVTLLCRQDAFVRLEYYIFSLYLEHRSYLLPTSILFYHFVSLRSSVTYTCVRQY